MRLRPAVLLVIGILAIPSSAASQESPRMSGLSVGGMPHPASAALAFWDTLDLTEEQVRALRRVEARASTPLMEMYQLQTLDTSRLLRSWRPGPIDSAAVHAEALAAVDMHVRFTLAALRARDETWRILSPAQRARLDSLVIGQLTHPTHPEIPCHRGGSGGVVRVSDRAVLVYSVQHEGDSARIGAVTVALDDDELAPVPAPSRPAGSSPRAMRGGGGSAGRWMILHEEDSDVVWIDSMRVDLKGHNVVLLHGADRVTILPDVGGLVSVPPWFRTDACRGRSVAAALRDHVLASPEVRAFLEGSKRGRRE